MSDRTLTCRDCGQAFTFTAGEQAFYQERGFSEPQRCPSCRAQRKAQRNTGGYDSAGYGVYCRECFQSRRASTPRYGSY
jgi:hypothetical protein